MTNDKFNRCIKSYVEEMKKVGIIAHTGRVTIMAIMNHIPKELLEVLTADQIGKTMAAAQKGYLAAKGELMGLELVDGPTLRPMYGFLIRKRGPASLMERPVRLLLWVGVR